MSENDIEVAFTGRLTADPVQRFSKTGKPWLAMNLAVGSGDGVQFASVALFGEDVPERVERLHNGDRCYVEGRLQLRTWTGQDGRGRIGADRTAPASQVEDHGSLHESSRRLASPSARPRAHAEYARRRDPLLKAQANRRPP